MTADADLFKLYDDLVRHTHAEVERHARKGRDKAEAHIQCPECSHESSPRAPHCSFSENGWYCFVCSAHGSLHDLAKRVGLATGENYAPRRTERVAKPVRTGVPYWQTLTPPETALRGFLSAPDRFDAWQGYKPLSRETIERHQLGVGVLPKFSSKCAHRRLIVPVYWGTIFVGFRGRALECSCGKWLATDGFDFDAAPLYNQDALTPGATVVIGENPVDALMLTERTPYVGVATYAVSYWREAWEQALLEAQPELVVVGYDQDLPGNGGAARRAEFEQLWLTNPKHKRVPPPAGPRLANRLIEIGLPAVLFDWGDAPLKSDIGSLLMGANA